jgi:hypothetical protein
MCFTLALAYALALASVIAYDHKWRYNLEHHLLTTIAVSITIVVYNTGHRWDTLISLDFLHFLYKWQDSNPWS